MAISENKKCQTLINIAAEQVEVIKAAADRLEAVRALYVAQGVSATGTPLQGHVETVSGWIDSVRSVADAAVPNGLIAARVPSHRNKALGDI